MMCLKKLLSLKLCSYIKELSPSKVSFTPIGEMIKENILSQLTKSYLHLPKVNVFSMPSFQIIDPIQYENIVLHKSVLDYYDSGCKHWTEESPYPFGIIQRIKCVRDSVKSEKLWNVNEFECFAFSLFCPFNDSSIWYQRLQVMRQQWWRNLSKSPLKSKFISETKDSGKSSSQQQWLMSYKVETALSPSPELKQIESIKYIIEHKQLKKRNMNFHLIVCDVDLDNATSAFLYDSYSESDSISDPKKIMRFNHIIAPFKVAIHCHFDPNSQSENKSLMSLTDYIFQALKESGISVFPLSFERSESLLEKFDELGIPYVIKLTQNTQHNGVVNLRTRDTNTEEDVHITRLIRTLCAYLS